MQKSTSTTRKKRGDRPKFKPANWFHAHQEAKLKIGPEPTAGDNVCTRLWPVTRDYYSPVELIFLCQSYDPLRMNQRPLWLARDGLVPLLWFFKMNPEPGLFQQQLLVHESLQSFVPPAWREVTGTYKVVNNPAQPARPATSLLVTSLVSEAYCSAKVLRAELDALKARYGEAGLKNLKKYCFLPWSFHGNKPEFQTEFIIEICRALGAEDLQPLSYARLDAMASFDGTEIVDLNENLLCADNYLVHTLLQRGAQLPHAQAAGTGGAFVSLS
ncbi:MAG TPA: hypothetical protein VFV50_01755, partial [Bdellovibrionales bacterium]|nr:hypothetical protein [Bdellovibrionales bacterium]